ncbi:hypothetical protein [Cellulomonas sp. SLBN-39]|uniref:hypothetical protein n=1 Tax=Cellulomonas sp. SLBN-39 TaxID=2768446 RepID=UPI00114FCB68|nr:hypothetical protein [Cellulomonas sp. SLBN-39]TQL01793.1 hypothetical protein FBY24_0852 [Cellulomonas sp. SLBN-39]
MPYFCVNKNAQPGSRDHEVHDTASTKRCLPDPVNQLSLGYHATCAGAVQAAKLYYNDVNGCAQCAPTCHTT